MKRSVKINFKGFWGLRLEESPFYKLLSKRFDLEISDNPDFLIYTDGYLEKRKYQDCVRIFYTGENTRPDFYDCDYAFTFDLAMTRRHYRLPLYRFYGDYDRLKQPKDPERILAQKSGFCYFLYSHITPEREDFFNRMLAYKMVDSGGRFLNTLGRLVPKDSAQEADFRRRYKFAIVFENSCHPGYTTEKIYHAMIDNVVPIYWGNPRIAHDFNPKSFINCHEYDDFSQVVDKVIEMDNDDDLYKSCLAQPWLNDAAGLDYLSDDSLLARFEEIFSNPEPIRYRRAPPLTALPLSVRFSRAVHDKLRPNPMFAPMLLRLIRWRNRW